MASSYIPNDEASPLGAAIDEHFIGCWIDKLSDICCVCDVAVWAQRDVVHMNVHPLSSAGKMLKIISKQNKIHVIMKQFEGSVKYYLNSASAPLLSARQ